MANTNAGADIGRAERRSIWTGVPIGAAALSALGAAILLVGVLFDIEGAQSDEEGPFIFAIAWFLLVPVGLVALVTGIAALALGIRRREQRLKRAGLIAVAWVAVGVLLATFVFA